MDDFTEIKVVSVQEVAATHAVCVVRCITGNARVGEIFDVSPTGGRAELREIEWYGQKVEVLDEGHSGKVVLDGDVGVLQAYASLVSRPSH